MEGFDLNIFENDGFIATNLDLEDAWPTETEI